MKINNLSVDYEGINEQKSAITSYCDHALASKALMMEKARQFRSSLDLLCESLDSLRARDTEVRSREAMLHAETETAVVRDE